MHGNNKTEAELELALARGVGHVIVDSLDEIDRLGRIAAGRPQRVLLRVTPGIRPDTHDKIATGQEDSKFGIPMALLPEAVDRCAAAGLEVRGLHAHIGSQVFDLDVYETPRRGADRRRRLPGRQHGRRLRRRLHARPGAAAARRLRGGDAGAPAAGSRSSASRAARWSPTPASRSTRSARSRTSRRAPLRRRRRRHVRQHSADALRRRLRSRDRRPDRRLHRLPPGRDALRVRRRPDRGGAAGGAPRRRHPRRPRRPAPTATRWRATTTACRGPPVVFCRDGDARVVVRRETYEDLTSRDAEPRPHRAARPRHGRRRLRRAARASAPARSRPSAAAGRRSPAC